MAPIKFEEQIKDKLEQRSVTPSKDAWSKLSQQLDTEEKRNKKSAFWWFGIAASIAALVFVSISYLNSNDESEMNNTIVKDEIKEVITPKVESEIINPNNETVNETVVKTEDEENKSITEKKTQKTNRNNIIKDKLPLVNNKSRQAVAKLKNDSKTKQEDLKPITPKSELVVPVKSEVQFNSVANVLQEVKSKNKVTDQQIDSLLKVANRELLMDKAIKNKSSVVDADALLQDVEDAMGESFRTKVYETLKSGFKEVKTRVAQRNN